MVCCQDQQLDQNRTQISGFCSGSGLSQGKGQRSRQPKVLKESGSVRTRRAVRSPTLLGAQGPLRLHGDGHVLHQLVHQVADAQLQRETGSGQSERSGASPGSDWPPTDLLQLRLHPPDPQRLVPGPGHQLEVPGPWGTGDTLTVRTWPSEGVADGGDTHLPSGDATGTPGRHHRVQQRRGRDC